MASILRMAVRVTAIPAEPESAPNFRTTRKEWS